MEKEDPVVYTLTGTEDGRFVMKDVRASELRNAAIGTVFSAGDPKGNNRQTMTVRASSGKERGGVGVVIESVDPFHPTPTVTAAWMSDNEPAREMELSGGQTANRGPAELTSAEARLLREFDDCQQKIDLLSAAEGEDREEALLDRIQEAYGKQWKKGAREDKVLALYLTEDGVAEEPAGAGKEAAEGRLLIARIPPVSRLSELMKIKNIGWRDLVMDAVSGGDEMLKDKGIQLSSAVTEKIYTYLNTKTKEGFAFDLKDGSDSTRMLERDLGSEVEKDLDRWGVEKSSSARNYLREKFLDPFLDRVRREKQKWMEQQKSVDSRLAEIQDVPAMKRMAYEMRIEAFTRNVNKDLERYVKKTETYELRRRRDDDYVVPKDFFRKIEKAGLSADPDWKKKTYGQIVVMEEIGDETKYRVSMKKGMDPVRTLCGGPEGIKALKKILRNGYLRQVQLEAEQFNMENNNARARELLDTMDDISREEAICHELSSPAVKNGNDLRSNFQSDLQDLRERRDQLYSDLQVSPGLKNEKVFTKIQKEVSNLKYDKDRAVEKVEARIEYNRFTGQASAPARLLETLADKYGLQTAKWIPGYEQQGVRVLWTVPPGQTPLQTLGINRRELGNQLIQEKREKVLGDIRNAIEHPEPVKEKKYYWNRSRGGRER